MFPDGKTLPVVSGGSDDSFSLTVPDIMVPDSTEPAVAPSQEVVAELSEFAQGVLAKIPEADRNTVGKYMKEWDSNVTKQFQKIHNEYEPYKAYGSVEELEQSMSYIRMLNDDPVGFIERVQQAIEEMGLVDTDSEYEPVGNGEVPEQFEGIDPAFVQKFMQMENQLNSMNEHFEQQTAAAEQAEQMQMLDNLFKDMHNEHGDFSEDFVLVQLSKGLTPEAAMAAWNAELERFGSPAKRPAPNLFRGGGSTPGGQVVPSKLSKADAKSYFVQQLQAAQDN